MFILEAKHKGLILRLFSPFRKNTPHVSPVTKPWMSPPLTGHRDDCSGAQRASWHPVLSLLSQSLSHPSLPFCLALRQALMHAYIIIGLGKAQGAGAGVMFTAFTGNVQQETQQRGAFTQTHFTYCHLNWEIGSKTKSDLNQIMTWSGGMWNLIKSVWIAIFNSHLLTRVWVFFFLSFFCRQANEYSLPPLNAGLEDVKPSLSSSASSDLASSVSQSYSVVTGTIWLMLHWRPKEYTQLQRAKHTGEMDYSLRYQTLQKFPGGGYPGPIFFSPAADKK